AARAVGPAPRAEVGSEARPSRPAWSARPRGLAARARARAAHETTPADLWTSRWSSRRHLRRVGTYTTLSPQMPDGSVPSHHLGETQLAPAAPLAAGAGECQEVPYSRGRRG